MFPFCQPHHPDTGFLASPSLATPALINTAVVTQLSFTCFQTAHWEQTLACANLNLAQALSRKMLLGTNQNCHRVCSDNLMVQSCVSAPAHSLIYHKRYLPFFHSCSFSYIHKAKSLLESFPLGTNTNL